MAAGRVPLLGPASMVEYSSQAGERWHMGDSSENFKILSFRL